MQLLLFTYKRNIFPPALPKRTLAFHELTFVVKGVVSYLVDGKKYTAKEGEAFFLPFGCERERELGEQRATYASFNFLTDEEISLPLILPNATSGEGALLLACAEEIKRKYYPNEEKQLELLCQCFIENLSARQKAAREHSLISKIKKYINERFFEKITLQTIGDFTYFSPLYCETAFKRETGFSIIQYLLERRMEEAKKLLSEGSLPIKKVAETVGFEDSNYFARVFKKREGVTPREYKKALAFPL